jgi:hypothetical protein
MSNARQSPHAGLPALLTALLVAAAAGVVAGLSARLTVAGIIAITACGSLIGWGLERAFEKKQRGLAIGVMVVALVGAGLSFKAFRAAGSAERPGASAESSGHGRGVSGTTSTAANAGASALLTATPTRTNSAAAAKAPPKATAGADLGGGGGSTAPNFEWVLDASRPSNASPRIAANVSDSSMAGYTDLRVDMSNLSIGAIEFDVYRPDGGSLFGWSRANPNSQYSADYFIEPPQTGTYRVTLRDKETGQLAESSFYATQAPQNGPEIYEPASNGSVGLDGYATGRACTTDGALVVFDISHATSTDSIYAITPDGQNVSGGISVDSVGNGNAGYVVKSDRCTGESVRGFAVKVLGAGGNTLATYNFAVPN